MVQRAAAHIPRRSDPGLPPKRGVLDMRVRYTGKVIKPPDTEAGNGDVVEGLNSEAARVSATIQQKSRELSR
jgi:hypothetical protein